MYFLLNLHLNMIYNYLLEFNINSVGNTANESCRVGRGRVKLISNAKHCVVSLHDEFDFHSLRQRPTAIQNRLNFFYSLNSLVDEVCDVTWEREVTWLLMWIRKVSSIRAIELSTYTGWNIFLLFNGKQYFCIQNYVFCAQKKQNIDRQCLWN